MPLGYHGGSRVTQAQRYQLLALGAAGQTETGAIRMRIPVDPWPTRMCKGGK